MKPDPEWEALTQEEKDGYKRRSDAWLSFWAAYRNGDVTGDMEMPTRETAGLWIDRRKSQC